MFPWFLTVLGTIIWPPSAPPDGAVRFVIIRSGPFCSLKLELLTELLIVLSFVELSAPYAAVIVKKIVKIIKTAETKHCFFILTTLYKFLFYTLTSHIINFGMSIKSIQII